MIKPRVYIETSIPSFYCDTRSDSGSLARANWTQHWWDFKREEYELVTSEAVLDELRKGDYTIKKSALELISSVPILPIDPQITDIITVYIDHSIMPDNPTGDALHLAVASVHKCDFLLTWNCKHLANANKFRHIQRINTMLGLFVPTLVTPLNLLAEEE